VLHNHQRIYVEWDVAWGTRGFAATHGSGKMLAILSSARSTFTSYPCIYHAVTSKPRTRQSFSNRTINYGAGIYDGSSKSMESHMLSHALDYLQQHLSPLSIKLSVCYDGDAASQSILSNHPIVASFARDRSHILKGVYKHVHKHINVHPALFAKHLQKYLFAVLSFASSNHIDDDSARSYFINYINHMSNNHDHCLPQSSCQTSSYIPSSLHQQLSPSISKLSFSISYVLCAIWPLNSHYVSAQRTSHVESAHHVATHLHPKHIDLPKSWPVRDALAVQLYNTNNTATNQLVHQTLQLPAPSTRASIQLQHRDHKSLKSKSRRGRKRKVPVQPDAVASISSKPKRFKSSLASQWTCPYCFACLSMSSSSKQHYKSIKCIQARNQTNLSV
jgi:hypothetical protein